MRPSYGSWAPGGGGGRGGGGTGRGADVQGDMSQTAFAVISRAIQLEEGGGPGGDQRPAALQLYLEGYQLMQHALELGDNSQASQALEAKMQRNASMVLGRIQALQEALGVTPSNSLPTSIAPVTGSTCNSGSPTDGDPSCCGTGNIASRLMNKAINMAQTRLGSGANDGPDNTLEAQALLKLQQQQQLSGMFPPPPIVQSPQAYEGSPVTQIMPGLSSSHFGGVIPSFPSPPTGFGSKTTADSNMTPALPTRSTVQKRVVTRPEPKPTPAPPKPTPVPPKPTSASLKPATASAPVKKPTVDKSILRGIDSKLQEIILNEIVDHDPDVTFDDIGGLEEVKQTLNELVILPHIRPDLYQGLRAPAKGLLLFGPPGNGKTMIAKAVAHEAKARFFSISASSLTSKWVGEGEKLVRALFAVARYLQPSIIFIDEIDSIMSERSSTEHDAMRRLKTEFLVQFDGVTSGSEEQLLIMGATNRPQDLDEAARRRLVKRIYVGLPDANTRMNIMAKLLQGQPHAISAAQLTQIATATEGYSGADLKALCTEAALQPLRQLSPSQILSVEQSAVRPISISDFAESMKKIRPSVLPENLAVYRDFNAKFGTLSF
ncbi:neuronal spastin [Pelomyxa schiedti]|nr:neuronal spastin [Pelomyxa schiedti]